jgi:hypothetical protein
MAHSYVEYNQRDFRVHDLDLIVVCTLVMNNAVKVDYKKLQPMFDEWAESISNDGPGCIDLQLDGYLVDDESVQKLIQILDLSKRELSDYPETYPKSKLNVSLKKFKINLENDYKTELIGAVLSGIKSLVEVH